MIPTPDPHSTTKKKCPTTDFKPPTEDESDEIRIFSASSVVKNEPDADADERLSPVVEEPTSPNTTNPVYNHLPEFYPFPFLYPYFFSAAAQAHTPNLLTSKTPTDIPASHLFGNVSMPPFSFPGMPFPYGTTNQAYPSNFFNPFSMPAPSSQAVRVFEEKPRVKQPHVKKPLNAFMIFMKEQRAHLIEESALKESSAINKLLGQKWKELSRTEQDRYYVLAKEERNRHLQMYPNWSARDNYGLKKKKPTGRVEKQTVHRSKTSTQLDNDPKKCRARFGLEAIHQWCKHCRRKKKCTRFHDDETISGAISSPDSSLSASEDILSRQIDSIEDDHNDSNEENKQRFPLKASTMTPYFTSPFL